MQSKGLWSVVLALNELNGWILIELQKARDGVFLAFDVNET